LQEDKSYKEKKKEKKEKKKRNLLLYNKKFIQEIKILSNSKVSFIVCFKKHGALYRKDKKKVLIKRAS
jgi:hypothetical protein